MQNEFKKDDIIEITIHDIADSDQYVGRSTDGQVIFIKGTNMTIGDVVQAKVFKVKKNYIESFLVKILQPSPHRIIPPCKVFGACGGCKYQHIPLSYQHQFKEKKIKDALEKIGGITSYDFLPIDAPADEYFYRNKIEFSFSNRKYFLNDEFTSIANDETIVLGFHPTSTYKKVIDIDKCHIAPKGNDEFLHAVRNFARSSSLKPYDTMKNEGFWRHLVLRYSHYEQAFMVNIVTGHYEETLMKDLCQHILATTTMPIKTIINNTTNAKNNFSFGQKEFVLYGDGFLLEQLESFQFKISSNSFFQTNTKQTEKLYQAIVREAHINKEDIVYDLYCGTGTISIFVSEYCKKVLGIELVQVAVENARENAERNKRTNCFFEILDMKDIKNMSAYFSSFGKPSILLVDPPRAGLHPNACEYLRSSGVKRIVYVSCNPASLARDSKMICDSSSYTLTKIVAVEMFPHTNHIESIAIFEKI